MRVGALGLVAFAFVLAGAAPNGNVKLNQGGWARMLADRMGVRATSDAEAMAFLGGRGGEIAISSQAARLVSAEGAQRSWRWDVTVPKTAIWLLSIENRTGAFVSVDKSPSTLVPAAPAGGASDAGRFPLGAGTHAITVAVGQNVAAPDLRLVGGCATVEPPGGWSNAPLTYGTLARTLVTAMRQSARLPAAEALASSSAKAARTTINVPADGTYTLLFGGKPLDGASYRLDGCEETRLLSAATADGWREGATTTLSAGEHTLAIHGVDPARGDLKVRLVRRSSSDVDYLSVLQAMGVKLQPVAMLDSKGSSLAMVGGPRHAQGDLSLRDLASRTVSREDAERIANHPAIARHLANGATFMRDPSEGDGDEKKKTGIDPLKDPSTYSEPVSPTTPGSQFPDPL